jgi:effector-binding domain-containing protein
MRIAKYIFLLFLLIAGTLSVFVATKDGKYFIEKSKIIEVPRATVYNYIADSKNWDTLNPWKEEKNDLKTIERFENDSILQILKLNDVESNLRITLSDTLKNTKIVWSTKGEMGFKDKFFALINRGVKNTIGEKFDKGLVTLNTILTTEINTFDIKMNGFVERDTIFYIQRPISCTTEELPKKIKSILPKLNQLLKNTNTPSDGAPFIIYHSRDTINNKITFSVAIPTKQKVFTTPESDIYTGQTNPFQAVKATLTGNYSHKKEAIRKIFAFMEANRLEQSDRHKEIEIIPVNNATEKSASKWVTEIYIPVRPKKTTVTNVKPVKKDSITTVIDKEFK